MEHEHLVAEFDERRSTDGEILINDEAGANGAILPLSRHIPVYVNPTPNLTRKLALLSGLYIVQLLPMSFAWYIMPLLLRKYSNYGVVGAFYVAQCAYSVKILWSPLVECLRFPSFGRRKSWLVPCFIAAGAILFWLGFVQDDLMAQIVKGEGLAVLLITVFWAVLVFACACIRMSIDGFALDLISYPDVHWLSPVASCAEVVAGFISFTMFLTLDSSSSDESSQSIPQVPSVKSYFHGLTVVSVVTAILLLTFMREAKSSIRSRSIQAMYRIIYRIVSLRHVQILCLIHLTSMIGFLTNDSITFLQLEKNKLTDSQIAALSAVKSVVALVSGILVSWSFRTYHPLHVWRKLFPYRLGAAVIAQGAVMLVFIYRDHHWRWVFGLIPAILSATLEMSMFVALMAFHVQIADARYGGIYIPLLSTTLDIRYDVLGFIYTEIIGFLDKDEDLNLHPKLIDGYQIVNAVGVIIAIPVFYWFLIPATKFLQNIDREKWRVEDESDQYIESDSGAYRAIPLEDHSRLVAEEVRELI